MALKRAHLVFSVRFGKVKDITSEFKKSCLENFNLLTFGAGKFICQISHPFKGSKFQPVCVSERQTTYLLCTVISGLGSLNLVIKKNNLWACFAKYFVFGFDLAKYCVRFINHDDTFCWIRCNTIEGWISNMTIQQCRRLYIRMVDIHATSLCHLHIQCYHTYRVFTPSDEHLDLFSHL